jgi:hypothetical protein
VNPLGNELLSTGAVWSRDNIGAGFDRLRAVLHGSSRALAH